MNRITSLFIFALLSTLLVSAQEGSGSPYALFGDNTFTLDIKHKDNQASWSIIVLLSDSTFAAITVDGDSLRVKDMSGNTVASRAVNPTVRAIFTGTDPKADEMPWVSPYVYCFGNPIRFTDKDGERPNLYESALMAEAAYVDEDTYDYCIKNLEKGNWYPSKTFGSDIQKNHPAKTGIGLQSMIFERETENGKEYAYVFAGTNSWEDMFEDLTQIVGISAQLPKAIENAKKLHTEAGNDELTFIGHSLGAMEAAAASMATGRAAIAFNPAVLSYSSCLLNGLGIPSELFNNLNIENYISSTPSILGISFPVDYVTLMQKQAGLTAPGRHIPIHTGFLPTHSMTTIIKALESK